MQNTTNEYKQTIDAPVRRLDAKVELFNGSTLVDTFTKNDAIKSIDIERVGEDSKFFGFGVSHKFNIKLIDKDRLLNISTANHFKINLGAILFSEAIEYIPFTSAHVTEVNRDENTNELSITAYCKLNNSKSITINELELEAPYTIKDVAEAVGTKLGATTTIIDETIMAFNTEYIDGANFEGTETLEEGLKAIAEATQTIYFMNGEDALVFKRLDQNGEAVKTIDKEKYITLDSKTNRRLATICHATELGDNVSASITELGTTQYVRDNPFWELREDIAEIVENAIASIGGLTINQFECEWRGDFSLEPCDKIALTTKDNNTVVSYILNDSLHYSGALEESTEWQYTESEETESNPSNLGDALKQTYARVDKANKQITLLASETATNSSAISSLQVETNRINASVQKIEQTTNEALEGVNNDIETLTKTVAAKMSAEDVTLEIKKEMENGVSKVETATGFKFDENGLTVSKTGSEMTTTIDENGMTIKRDEEEQLVADNEGVKAYDLHAKTYLIVGESSRFEDYEKDGEARTGCFWIGGNE